MNNTKSEKSNVSYEDGFFMGKNDIKIYYKSYEVDDSKSVIVISHGFCESSEKYRELIKTLNKNNYAVYIIDHRGHGQSGRLGIDNSQINVEDFNYYVEDLKTFLDSIVMPDLNNRNLYLYAHSMGGAIGTLFLEKYNQYFKKAILNCPMMKIDTGKYPYIVAKILAKTMCMIGMGNRYLPGQSAFNGKPDLISSATSSQKRYDSYFNKQLEYKYLQTSGGSFNWIKQAFKGIKELFKKENINNIKADILLFQAGKDTFVKPDLISPATSSQKRYDSYFNKQLEHKYLQTSGGSFNWINQAFKGIKELFKKENINNIKADILLFQAGKDTFVKPEGHNKFVSLAKTCEFVRIEDSKQEIYIERDEIRDQYIERVLDFYNK